MCRPVFLMAGFMCGGYNCLVGCRYILLNAVPSNGLHFISKTMSSRLGLVIRFFICYNNITPLGFLTVLFLLACIIRHDVMHKIS